MLPQAPQAVFFPAAGGERCGPSGHRRGPVPLEWAGSRESGRCPKGVGVCASGHHARFPDPVKCRIHASIPPRMLFLTLHVPTHQGEEPFFFVQGFDNPGIAGRAGKIAGPPLIQGTRYSGVVVTTFDGPVGELSQADLLVQGSTMAHEGGHYLGLYHPTESPGAGSGVRVPWDLVDPLGDTPECSVVNDVDGNGVVSGDECIHQDGPNLMFWGAAPVGVVQDQLTAGQRFVLHRNPYVH